MLCNKRGRCWYNNYALASPKKTGAADLKSLFGTGVSVKIDTPRFNVKY